MRTSMHRLFAVVVLWLGATAPAAAGEITDVRGRTVSAGPASRVVSLGGGITELVVALGAGQQLVGVDDSSTHPEQLRGTPTVGFYRAVSSEGVLSLAPDLVIAHEGAGPPAALAQLEAAGVAVAVLPEEASVDGLHQRLAMLGALLDRTEQAATLRSGMDAQLQALPAPASPRPRVMFVYARGGGTLNVSGTGTAADAMIRLAGGDNAVTGYDGYRPLTAEAAVVAAPDLVLLTTGGLQAVGGVDGLLASPGLSTTPAGKARRVVAMDDLYLLGFGPRTPAAAAELAALLQDAR